MPPATSYSECRNLCSHQRRNRFRHFATSALASTSHESSLCSQNWNCRCFDGRRIMSMSQDHIAPRLLLTLVSLSVTSVSIYRLVITIMVDSEADVAYGWGESVKWRYPRILHASVTIANEAAVSSNPGPELSAPHYHVSRPSFLDTSLTFLYGGDSVTRVCLLHIDDSLPSVVTARQTPVRFRLRSLAISVLV